MEWTAREESPRGSREKGSQAYLKRELSATKEHCLEQIMGYLERKRKHMLHEICLAVGLETFRVKTGSYVGQGIVSEKSSQNGMRKHGGLGGAAQSLSLQKLG